MNCACCSRALDPRQAWKGSAEKFFCNEFCADDDVTPIVPGPAMAPALAQPALQSQP